MQKKITDLHKKIENKNNLIGKKSNTYSNIRLLIFILIVANFIIYFNTHQLLWLIPLVIFISSFIIVIIIHHNIDKEIEKNHNLIKIIERYENRFKDDWKKEPYTTYDEDINFIKDLDIMGKNSLMQYLNFTSSLGGFKELKKTLSLENVRQEHILENQKAVGELKDNFDFCINFKERIDRIENIDNIDFKELFSLFDKKLTPKKTSLTLSLMLSFSSIITLLLACFSLITPIVFTVLFFAQLGISYIYSLHHNEAFEDIEKSSRIFSKLSEPFKYVYEKEFTDPKLIRLKQNIQNGSSIIKDLSKIREIDLFRTNFLTNILLNVFCSLNFYLLYTYSKLLSKHIDILKSSIQSLEEFEVLISLTTICFVKEEYSLPTIEKELKLDIESIKHPLITEKLCVSNDFNCLCDINIITGSNMSGKTSFMRTIGINLVLAYSGTYVTAKNFACPIMKIFTSINVKDDIANGISTFYGELKRIKDILDFSQNNNGPMIIFIDEIFKGTNYNDRILGAKETLKRLSNLDCIVFLTTHDFELCEIKSKMIHNYHFQETYTKDKINFDYMIKDGQCKTTNAKYLMQQMGIIKNKS